MQETCVQGYAGSVRATAKEIHSTAFSHQSNGCFPCLRFAYRLDDRIEWSGALASDQLNQILSISNVDDLMSAQSFCRLQSLLTAASNGDMTIQMMRECGKHQADRPGT